MFKHIWIPLFIVGLTVVFLLAEGFGAFAQTQIRMDKAVVSLTNAAPDVGAIDLYIDRNRVIKGLQINDSAVNIPVAPGKHLVGVFPAGGNIDLMTTTDLRTR